MHFKIGIGYNTVALITEIHTIFLHSRKLLQLSKVGYDTTIYKVIKYVNLGTFFPCRAWADYIMASGMVLDFNRAPPKYFKVLCVAKVYMTILNLVLLWQLVSSDVLRNMKWWRKLNGKKSK